MLQEKPSDRGDQSIEYLLGDCLELTACDATMEVDAIHDALHKDTSFLVGRQHFLYFARFGKQSNKSSLVQRFFVFLLEFLDKVVADQGVETKSSNISLSILANYVYLVYWFG